MYKCNLCERSFSKRASLSRHRNQLHPYSNKPYPNNKHSRTLNWIEDQQLNVSIQQNPPLQPLNNSLWKEFDNLNNFSQNADKENNEENGVLSKSKIDNHHDFLLPSYLDNENIMEEKEYESEKEEDKNTIEEEEYESSIEETKSNIEEKENQWLMNSDDRDPEDFYGVGLADAYEDLNKSKSEQTLWPSETYKEFMTAVTQYRLTDAAADSMLRIIRKHCTDSLPGSTRKGRMYMDQMNIKNFNIKTKNLCEFEGKIYKFFVLILKFLIFI